MTTKTTVYFIYSLRCQYHHSQLTMELDDDIKERISIWVQLVEVTLNVKLAQENLSLEDWVSSSVEKGRYYY